MKFWDEADGFIEGDIPIFYYMLNITFKTIQYFLMKFSG